MSEDLQTAFAYRQEIKSAAEALVAELGDDNAELLFSGDPEPEDEICEADDWSDVFDQGIAEAADAATTYFKDQFAVLWHSDNTAAIDDEGIPAGAEFMGILKLAAEAAYRADLRERLGEITFEEAAKLLKWRRCPECNLWHPGRKCPDCMLDVPPVHAIVLPWTVYFRPEDAPGEVALRGWTPHLKVVWLVDQSKVHNLGSPEALVEIEMTHLFLDLLVDDEDSRFASDYLEDYLSEVRKEGSHVIESAKVADLYDRGTETPKAHKWGVVTDDDNGGPDPEKLARFIANL
jgi:hypothetical protein